MFQKQLNKRYKVDTPFKNSVFNSKNPVKSKMFEDQDLDSYFFIHLIGNKPDVNKNSNKIDGYYQITNGILIKYFTTQILCINPSNVKIFAYGTERDYDKFIYTNYKSYFQLDLDNIFKININTSEILFDYFTNFDTVFTQIEQILIENPFKTIVLFLDDHGSKGFFVKIGYFHLYKMFMKHPNNQILVLNDSCYSGSMINIINAYDKIYELKIKNEIKKKIDPRVLLSFFNLIKYALQSTNIDELFQKLNKLIEFYQNITISNDILFEKLINLEISSDIKTDLSISEVCNFADEINKIGFFNIQNIIDFQNIFRSMEYYVIEEEEEEEEDKEEDKDKEKEEDKEKEKEEDKEKEKEEDKEKEKEEDKEKEKEDKEKKEENKLSMYTRSKKMFTVDNLDFIKKLSKDNLQLFIDSLESLYISNEFVDFKYRPHPNIEIITSTDENRKCPSFTTIRVNKVTKVYPGSPAMSSFIKEIFMNSDKKAFDFNNIQKDISENDGKYIIFSVNLDQKDRNIRKKRKWVHLFPKHYVQTKNNYLFQFSVDVKLKVAALRAISFLIVNNLKETINCSLNKDVKLYKLNSFNDNIADIVAIVAVLKMRKYKYKEADNLIKNCILKNKVFNYHQIGNQMLRYIINFSFYLSDSPIKMSAIILNIFQVAIKFEIFQNIRQKDHYKNIFLESEISNFIDHLNMIFENNETILENDNFLNNNKLDFIIDIQNAVFSLLDPKIVFFGSFIASSIIKDIDINKFKKSASIAANDLFYQKFLENLNDPKIDDKERIVNAECYILSYVKSSLTYLDSICSLYIKNDIMRYLSHQLQYFSTISIFKQLLESIGDEKNQNLIINIIEPIEDAALKANIPSFFIPVILASIPYNIIIYAIYISTSKFGEKSVNETINIIKNIYKGNLDKNACDAFITFAEFTLIDKDNAKNIKEYNDQINEMKNLISEKIKESINRIIKLINISKIRARENISRKITVAQLIEQINEYHDFLTRINDKNHTNKFHKYLYKSITSLSNDLQKIHKINVSQIPPKGFNANESLKNIDSLLERAANELYTVSHIFDISDNSNNQMIFDLSKKIDSEKAINFAIMIMTARNLNMVEMVPISEILDKFTELFSEENGENPNIRELMGLRAANIHILSEKDKKHLRSKIVDTDEFEKKYCHSTTENQEDEEDDLYYSENYFEDKNDLPYRKINLESMEDKTYLEQYPNFPLLPKLKYYKDQIFVGKIDMIKEELDLLGWSSFDNEIWKAFVYCFNDRMKTINIHFDPDNEYKNVTCPIRIDQTISIVRKFFPIHEITELWNNKERIERFVGQNAQFKDAIFNSFIKAFDDSDRIVSPIHLQTETYEERTSEILKLIFESYT